MFKKLTNKFTIILVVSISLVLIISFSVIYLTTKDGIDIRKDEEFNNLTASIRDNTINPFTTEPRPRREIYVVVFVDEPTFSYQTNDDLSEDEVQYLFDNVDDKTIDLNDELWESRTIEVHQKEAVIFINVTDLNGVVDSLVRSLLINGLIALIVMTFISRLFVVKVIKPVEASYKKQKDFVSSASHELRTPLAIMNSNIDILLNYSDKTEKEKESWLRLLKDEVLNMTTLSDSLLFLTSTKSTNLEEVNISDLVFNKLLMYDAILFENKIVHETNISKDLQVKGISTQLNQLFTNLIDNAIKYTIDKKIDISLFKKGNKITFEISNKTDQETIENVGNLFDRFYKVDKSRTSKDQKSYGLGLSIAKFIAENHDGKIDIDVNGELLTFSVTLPAI